MGVGWLCCENYSVIVPEVDGFTDDEVATWVGGGMYDCSWYALVLFSAVPRAVRTICGVMEHISSSAEGVVAAFYAGKEVDASGYMSRRKERGGMFIAVFFGE